MDLDSLKTQVGNISLYDIKAGFRKAQNAVMNYTEMEAKVREATNNEPWGCSNTVMQEIANGTFNYATLNEIMPMIYKRFTEKSAEEWRQIYKALQLLEFLIKNGSERVIDDARSHMSLLKMLRQFHYIDHNGKDQGINVRNRAKELAELLADVDRIRQERKKARSTRNKYGGVEGGAGIGLGGSGARRYGGFGSETAGPATFGGYSGGVYGDGGGFGGQTADFGDGPSRRERFDEYDEYDDGGAVASPAARSTRSEISAKRTSTKPEPSKPKEPEVDLFDFGDDDMGAPSMPTASNGRAPLPGSGTDDFGVLQSAGAADDDFDDFQSATPAQMSASGIPPPPTTSTSAATQFNATKLQPAAASMQPLQNTQQPLMSPPPSNTATLGGGAGANYSAFHSTPLSSPPQQNVLSPQSSQQQPKPTPTGYQAAAPNYFGSISTMSSTSTTASTPGAGPSNQVGGGGMTSPPIGQNQTASTKSGGGADPFASLGVGASKKQVPMQQGKGQSMASMAREKASAGIWGQPTQNSQQGQGKSQGGGSGGDLLGF